MAGNLRMTDEQYADYMEKRTKTGQEAIKTVKPISVSAQQVKQGVKAQKKRLVIHLDFALPTWNRLLAMGIWQRKKERDRIHKAVADAVSQLHHTENV